LRKHPDILLSLIGIYIRGSYEGIATKEYAQKQTGNQQQAANQVQLNGRRVGPHQASLVVFP
jgi:hypothetical protein